MERPQLVRITRSDSIGADEFDRFADSMFVNVWQNLFPPQIATEKLPSRVSENIITPTNAPIPDCRTCGACCAAFVCVSTAPGDDIPYDDCWDITADSGGEERVVDRYIRRTEERHRCVELEGEVGSEVGCRIYRDRPRMCRTFDAGSDRCHAVRRGYGLEPFLTLGEMADARAKLERRETSMKPLRIKSVRMLNRQEDDQVVINATLEDGSETVLHEYDPEKETWYRAQFEGLSVPEAKALVTNEELD